jgi:hypothetical protein
LLTQKKARTDTPEVKPLPLPRKKDEHFDGNDLNQISAEVLHSLSNIKRRKNESMHDYLHRAFEKHFNKS